MVLPCFACSSVSEPTLILLTQLPTFFLFSDVHLPELAAISCSWSSVPGFPSPVSSLCSFMGLHLFPASLGPSPVQTSPALDHVGQDFLASTVGYETIWLLGKYQIPAKSPNIKYLCICSAFRRSWHNTQLTDIC